MLTQQPAPQNMANQVVRVMSSQCKDVAERRRGHRGSTVSSDGADDGTMVLSWKRRDTNAKGTHRGILVFGCSAQHNGHGSRAHTLRQHEQPEASQSDTVQSASLQHALVADTAQVDVSWDDATILPAVAQKPKSRNEAKKGEPTDFVCECLWNEGAEEI